MKPKYVCLVAVLIIGLVACGPQAALVEQDPAGGTSAAGAGLAVTETVGTVADEPTAEAEHDEEQTPTAEAEHNEDEEHRDLDAHEHGAAELTLAWSGSELAIELRTPAHNVVGFEHAPETEAEQALLAESLQVLETGDVLRILPNEAGCTLTDANVETEMEAAHADEEATAEVNADEEETHSEIHIEYNLRCTNADAIEALDAGELFARFPNFAEVRTEWVSDTQQSAKELSRDDALLPLK